MSRWLRFALLLGLLFLAACAPAEVEPGFSGPLPITRGLTDTPTPLPLSTNQSPVAATPTPWETAGPRPTFTPWETPGPWPTFTPWETPAPQPTATPVPPLPGLLYATADGLWQVGGDWQPELLTSEYPSELSPDGTMILYQSDGDVWLLELGTSQRRNLTIGQGRAHCCAQWRPDRPGTIIFGSWETAPEEGDAGTGYLSAIQLDGSDYRVLVDAPSTAWPAPGPDGQTIAYDQGGEAWLYRWDEGSLRLEPADYDLEPYQRIGGPAWSSDGRYLAWTAGWPISLIVFDLENQTGWRLHPYENLGRGGWFAPPAWSTDDRWLAFQAEDVRPEAHGIWVAAVDGSTEHYLGPGFGPVWSPDGRWLAFSGPAAGAPDQYAVGWLVEVGSWYKIMIALPTGIPPGSQIVDWTAP